jgi:hypothetical protein
MAATVALTLSVPLAAQEGPPPLPQLSPEQAADVRQQVAQYRTATEQRVFSGEISPDEAERLIAWREWQLAQQAAGRAPRPQVPAERTIVVPASPPAPLYVPGPYYYGPYYYGYGPYYGAPSFGLSICAGRAYRNGWGSICF